MDTKQLQAVEMGVIEAAHEDNGPLNEAELSFAVQAFLAFDAESYILAKGNNRDRRVVLWIHSLSQFTRSLWELRQYDHLKSLYKEAVKRSDEVGDYGCMQRLLTYFLAYSRWFDNPRDYGYGESVVDYEKLYAEREKDKREIDRISERSSVKQALIDEVVRIRLNGFSNRSEEYDWKQLTSFSWTRESK